MYTEIFILYVTMLQLDDFVVTQILEETDTFLNIIQLFAGQITFHG